MTNKALDLPPGVRADLDGSFTMCSKKTACPSLRVFDDGSASISDNGIAVTFTEDQLLLLEQTLAALRAAR